MFWLCKNQTDDIDRPDKSQSLSIEADLIKGHMYSKISHILNHIPEDLFNSKLQKGTY